MDTSMDDKDQTTEQQQSLLQCAACSWALVSCSRCQPEHIHIWAAVLAG
jgi:hypothetical protein